MLVLSRKKDEAVLIGGNVSVVVLDVIGDRVKLGISAPGNVSVFREELIVRVPLGKLVAARREKRKQ